jgi:hypothetical protein
MSTRHAAARAARPEPAATPSRPRRTVEIRGHGAPAPVVPLRPEYADHRRRATATRRPRPRRIPAPAQPDRVALYAFLLGLTLILVAALSAHGG